MTILYNLWHLVEMHTRENPLTSFRQHAAIFARRNARSSLHQQPVIGPPDRKP
jgi:hypothetical protein